MGFTEVPDKAGGDVFTAAMWNTYIAANFNSGVAVKLADTVLGSDVASVQFLNIPQDWSHLWVDWYVRTARAVVNDGMLVRFNGDTGANYDSQYLFGQAAATAAGESFGQTSEGFGCLVTGASAPANLFGAGTVVIPRYSASVGNKAGLSSSVAKWGTGTANMQVREVSWSWRNNAAITQIDFIGNGPANIVTGSRFTLYGMP